MSRKRQDIREFAENREPGSFCSASLSEDSSEFPQDTAPRLPCDTAKADRSPLGDDDLDVLKRMVDEYKAHRVDFTSLPRRPRFKGPRVNTGISIHAEIRNRALQRAKADPDGTGGGNLSGLIEVLLWMFLGCPEDLIDRAVAPNNDP